MNKAENPYRGSRSFSAASASSFPGRELETDRLLSLAVSERLVLLHGPRGCGKTSLLVARLMPLLRENGFAVLPMGAIDGPVSVDQPQPANHAIFNLLCRLHQGGGDEARFSQMSLADFLDGLVSEDALTYRYEAPPEEGDQEGGDTPLMLVIDQLECPAMRESTVEEQADFFRQLAEAMDREPNLCVLLCCDDMHLAEVTAHAHIMVNHMRARFHLNYLTREEAREAVQQPLVGTGLTIAPDALTALLDLTCTENRVDCLLLQLCCTGLWRHVIDLNKRQTITLEDLAVLGEADGIMHRYMDDTLVRVAAEAGHAGLTLRTWIERVLITSQRSRHRIARDVEVTEGLSNDVIDLMVAHHLVAEETHTGGTVLKLAHHWMVDALREANRQRHHHLLARRRKKHRNLVWVLTFFLLISIGFAVLWPKAEVATRSSPAELDLTAFNDALFDALKNRGTFLMQAEGDTVAYAREALIDLRQAYDLRPHDKRVQRYLIMAYERLGEDKLVVEMQRQIAEE